MGELPDSAADSSLTPEVIATLVAKHREFLGFLEARVGSRAIAEEILQAAFVRTLERGSLIRESESAIAWFYRLLRNALIDHYRRSDRESRSLELERRSVESSVDEELRVRVCRCIESLISTLRADYGEILRRIELEERPLADVASALGITTNNAAVRLHRARQALKRQLERSCGTCAEHACLDCRCDTRESSPAAPSRR